MLAIDIDKAKDIIRDLGGRVGSVVRSGNGWKKLFVCDKAGCQVGRLTFLDDEITNVKSYKRDYHTGVDDTDLIFMRFDLFLSTGKIVSEETFWELWSQVQQIVVDDLAEKKANRAKLPTKKRKALQGKNPRTVFSKLLFDGGANDICQRT